MRNTLFVSPIVQVKIAFGKTQDKTLFFCNSPSKTRMLPGNKHHQMKICYLLHNSSDITEGVTLQSQLVCVSHAIKRFRALSSHSAILPSAEKDSSTPNSLASGFPSHEQTPCLPSAFFFSSQTRLDWSCYSNITTSDGM